MSIIDYGSDNFRDLTQIVQVNIRTLSKKQVFLIQKPKVPASLILLIVLAVVPRFLIHNYECQKTANGKSYHDAFSCKVRPTLE